MKVQSKAGTNFCALDDSTAGEGLSIFFSQGPEDINRWRFDVYAKLSTGQELLVGFCYVSPPSATNPPGELTRQIAAAVCPGAKSWSVVASPALGSQAALNEVADLTLISSKCCTAPVGVTRVGERYGYVSGTGTVAIGLLRGRTITGVAAIGLAGGGSLAINGGTTITIPAGIAVSLEPKALLQLGEGQTISFINVDWLIEFVESA